MSSLQKAKQLQEVYYAGLESHPQYQLAREQMAGFWAMLSFEIAGGPEKSSTFVESLDIFVLAESLGGVESLIEIPSLMTHASMSKEEREEVGINDGLIRLSPGIEEFEDLVADIKRGLEKF